MATPGSALLALRRTVADPGGVTAVLATVLLVCALVTGVVAAIPSLQQTALREAMRQLPPEQTAVEVRGPLDAEVLADQHTGVRRTTAPLLDIAGGVLVRRTETVAFTSPDGRRWSFASLVSDEQVVEAVRGRLPVDAPGLEVAAPPGSGLAPGDSISLVNPLDDSPVTAAVVGTWTPAAGMGGAVPADGRGALLVDDAAMSSLAARAAGVSWRIVPDLVALRPEQLDALAAAAAPVSQDLAVLAEQTSSTLQVENPLVGVAQERAAELAAQRTLLLMPAAVLLLLGAAVALLVASALASNRAGDEALLRSRGAGRRGLLGPAALEGLVLCLAAAGVGLALALGGLRLLGVPVALSAAPLLAAAVAATVCWLALCVPAGVRAVGGDRAMAAMMERRRRRATTLLITLVLLVLALGAIAVIGLRRLAAQTAPGVDLLATVAPALLLLACTVVLALLLLPLAFRLSTAGDRGRGVAVAVGTRLVARSAARALPLALVVGLVAGTLVYGAAEAAGRQATVETEARLAVGADVRVVAPPSSQRLGAEEERRRLETVPAVTGISPVHRELAYVADVPVEVLVADLDAPPGQGLVDEQTRDRLLEATDDAVPVVISEDLAAAASLAAGERLQLFVGADATLQVVEVVPDLPTVPEDRTGLLVHAGAAPPAAAHQAPDEWWLTVADGRAESAAATIRRQPGLAARVLSRPESERGLAGDPTGGGSAYGSVLTATAVGAGLLGVVLLVAVVRLRRADRAATTGFLRALGAGDRDVALTLALEQAVVTGGGVVVGALAGAATAAVVRQVGLGGVVAVPWPAVLPLAGLVLLPVLLLLVRGRSAEVAR